MQYQPQQYTRLQQPTVVLVPPQALEDKFKQSALSQMRVLSILQIVIGCLCIVFGAALTGLRVVNMHYDGIDHYFGTITGVTGCGMWIGVYFIIVGGIGIGAVRWNSSRWITSAMVLNIISSSLGCFILVYLSAIGIAQMSYLRRWKSDSLVREEVNADLALNCLLLLLAIAELAITIWSAALCCGAVCRCCKSLQMTTQYYTTPQPAVAYPGAQPISVQGQYIQPMGIQPQPSIQIQPQQPPNY